MKNLLTILCTLFMVVPSWGQQKRTEIIVIGNIHQAVPNYNSDTLLAILERIKPDIILHEIDSSFFTKDFRFKTPSKENEQNASGKYLLKYPKTLIRPFEFEGRNEYRKERGMVPTDNLTIKLLRSLYAANSLTPSQKEIIDTYDSLTEELKVMAAKSPEYFNNATTDSLAERRQFYQHKMLTEITNEREEFANTYLTKPNGEQISYRDGYQLWADFWDLRNQTMAKNIMRMANHYPGKRIVVLTGFLHRYYLLSELQKLKEGKNIHLKEYYDFAKK